MFVGHYSAALAAKAAEPRAPLWTYIAAAQLLDIGWSSLVMAGIEKVRFDPTLPGSALVLDYMPFTHSLPAALIWSAGALLACRLLMRMPWRAAVFVALVVFSHWLADLLVHRPDLELGFGTARVGLALWDFPGIEKTLEMGLIALGGGAWLWTRGVQGKTLWPALGFLTALLVLQIIGEMTIPDGSAAAFGRTGLMVYLAMVGLAVLVEWRGKSKTA